MQKSPACCKLTTMTPGEGLLSNNVTAALHSQSTRSFMFLLVAAAHAFAQTSQSLVVSWPIGALPRPCAKVGPTFHATQRARAFALSGPGPLRVGQQTSRNPLITGFPEPPGPSQRCGHIGAALAALLGCIGASSLVICRTRYSSSSIASLSSWAQLSALSSPLAQPLQPLSSTAVTSAAPQ